MTFNVKLKVSAFEMPPYVKSSLFCASCTSSAKTICRPGYAVDLLRLITGDAVWELTQHYDTGEAGNITGSLVNSIVNSITELSPPIMLYGEERSKVVNYLQPGISGTKQGYLVHHDEGDISWPIFAPFSRGAWLLGATAYMITAAALCVARYQYQRDFKVHNVVYQMSFGQKNHSVWKSRSERVVITVWSVLSKVIASLYCYYFVRAIPLSPAEVVQRFSSVKKVAAKLGEGYKLVIKSESQFYLNFMNNSDNKIRELFRQNYRLSSINDNNHSFETLVNYTLHNKKTIMPLGDVSIAIYYRDLFRNEQGESRNVLAVPDKWDALPRFSIASKDQFDILSLRFQDRVGRIREVGLAEKLARVYKMDDVTEQQDLSFRNDPNPLKDPINMHVAIKLAYVWLIGIVAALMSFAMEYFTGRILLMCNA